MLGVVGYLDDTDMGIANIKYSREKFYDEDGNRDYYRVPLNYPFYAQNFNHTDWWIANQIDSNNQYIYDVQSLDVKTEYLYIHSAKGSCHKFNRNNEVAKLKKEIGNKFKNEKDFFQYLEKNNLPKVDTFYYSIIKVQDGSQLNFKTEKAFMDYVLKQGLPLPTWRNIDSVSNDFTAPRKLPWDIPDLRK